MIKLPSVRALRAAIRASPVAYSKIPYQERLSSEEDPHDRDPEKTDSHGRCSSYSSDSSYSNHSSYSASSHEVSEPHEPILRISSGRRRPVHAPRCYKLPQRIVRYLCLALISTIVVLILSLIHLSHRSSRQVELGLVESKPPPPAWSEFPFLQRYYGGIRSLAPRVENVPEYPRELDEPSLPTNSSSEAESQPHSHLPARIPFNPYPDYGAPEYTTKYGPVVDCLANTNLSREVLTLRPYQGVPHGMPDAVMGSADVLGLRDDVCFDRYGRLGPYGYGYSMKSGGTGAGLHGDREDIEEIWVQGEGIDYHFIDWAALQNQCQRLNNKRFEFTAPVAQKQSFQNMPVGELAESSSTPNLARRDSDDILATTDDDPQPLGHVSSKERLPRTAFLIRTWWTYDYSEEDILFLRAIIAELSLLSGGEYTIHLLVHVQDNNAQIWADSAVYNDVVRQSVPEEFWGLVTLWSERQMGLVYGGLAESFYQDLPVHGVYRSAWMPVQWFAKHHPEYDYFWNWEMDARYTGHYYHLLERISKWSSEQPRKGLWERSGRFYVPTVHGSWDDFKQMVRVQTEMAPKTTSNVWKEISKGEHQAQPEEGGRDRPVWGPQRPANDELDTDADTLPPTSYEKDKYEWGVGEEADLITLNPLFDPAGTEWTLADDVTGYNTSDGYMPPRRAAIVNTARLSRRLLRTMHEETALRRHSMFSEMWPASIALHHGFKAVYAPHPVYIDRAWPVAYLAAVFNGGRNGAAGGARTSVFGSREHNFLGASWYYNAGFAGNLWRRWLGMRVDGGGGEEEEELAMGKEGEGRGEGRMCLPGILVHPVKGVRLVVEGNMGNVDEMRTEGEADG